MAHLITHVVSVRVPQHWHGRVTSDQVRAWVVGWLREPVPLNSDPAPGPYRISIRFSEAELSALKKRHHKSMSSVIRRIAALNMPAAPKGTGLKWLDAVLGIGLVLLSLFSEGRKSVGHEKGQKP